MGGEGVERHIGDDPELREASLEGTGRPLGQGIRARPLPPSDSSLQRRHREQGHRRYTQGHQFGGLFEQQIDGEPSTPGMEAFGDRFAADPPPARRRDR